MSVEVTVVIPVHNTAAGVLEGLDSLRAQTMPRDRFEAIYVNDGSTDGTGELLDSELAGEENFSVVHIENSGWPGRPRNIGLDRARGEYVFFMDDDDRLGAEALERLVAKARDDSADIVIGRMAGVGRRAPREIFQKPLSGGSLRTHPLLLTTLTVHKLFRADFLRSAGLRFPEGRVRLEDHMFMLPAYLRTDSVSVVHDYTCYYWVRHKEFGNISYRPSEPVEYFGSVERIIDIIESETDPGAFRDRLIAHWYRSKVLGRMQGNAYLGQSQESARRLYAAAGSLVRRRIPERVDAKLNPFSRLRAAVVRTGRVDLVRRVAEFEAELAHTTTVTGFRWSGEKLFVDIQTALVRGSDRQPLEFVCDGESVRWDLPAELAEVPSVRAAAEISGPLRKLNLRAFARNTETGADVTVPLPFTPIRTATGSGRCALSLTGTIEIDVARGNLGAALAGRWWFLTRVDLAGTSSDHTVGPLRAPAAEEGRSCAFTTLVDGTSVLVTPSYNRKGHLVLTVDDSWRDLGEAVQQSQRATVETRDGQLRLRIPLALRAGRDRVTLPFRLLGPAGSVEGTANVLAAPAAAGAPSGAVLAAQVPAIPHQGRWEAAVGSEQHPVPLGVQLSRTFGSWSVGVRRPSRASGLIARVPRGLRRRAGRILRRLGLR